MLRAKIEGMVNFIEFKNISSTNKYVLENINTIPANSVICAETQDAGRGRFSRKWISDKKDNCYMSFVLKPKNTYKDHFANLTQYLSVILCRELKKYGTTPTIKWPNDVQINGKKIAGILSEVSFSKSNINGIVLGLGVNLNLKKEDLMQIDIPATALNLETNSAIDKNKFIENLAENFFLEYEELLKNGFKHIRAEYISYCNFIGKEVTIKNPEPTNLGLAINIADDGTLELLTPTGEVNKIISGDVIIK